MPIDETLTEFDPAREPFATDPVHAGVDPTTGELPPGRFPPANAGGEHVEPLTPARPDHPTSVTRPVRPARGGQVLRREGDDYDRPPVIDHSTADPVSILGALDDWCAWHDFLTERYRTARAALRWADHDLAVKTAEARARVKRNGTKDRRTVADIDSDIVTWLNDNAREVVEAQITADVELDAIWKDLRNAERQIERLRSHNSTATRTYGAAR